MLEGGDGSVIRIFRVLVPASVLVLFLSEVALVFACYTAAVYADPDVAADIFLIDESGLWRIGLVVAMTILGLYFNNQYADIRITSPTRLLQQISNLLQLPENVIRLLMGDGRFVGGA